MVSFFGIVSLPLPAHAGGVQVSIGIGLPFPVAVVPAPFAVTRQPVIVQPALVRVTRALGPPSVPAAPVALSTM